MVKCKYCNEEVNEIYSDATATTTCYMNSDGDIELNENLNDIYEIDEFRCPSCDKILAQNQEEARKLFK